MLLIAALLSAALAAETSPSVAPAAAATTTAPIENPDKLVCRKGVNQTGSRMKQQPICLTRREWAERSRHDKELMDAIQRGSTANTRKPGTPQ